MLNSRPALQAAWSPVRLGSRDRVDTGLPALVCLPGWDRSRARVR
jgi:hypothetical protein